MSGSPFGILEYFGAKEQASAAETATNAQVGLGNRALAEEKRQFNISQKNIAPWLEAGKTDLANLQRIEGVYENAVMNPNQYKQSPGYGWLQQQGVDTLKRAGASSGQYGQTSKDLVSYGQGLALQDYTGYLGRLESLMNRYAGTSGTGQTAGQNLATLGQNYAGNVGGILGQQATAIGAGAINQANARTGFYNSLSNNFGNTANQVYSYFNRPQAGGGGYLPSLGSSQYTPAAGYGSTYALSVL